MPAIAWTLVSVERKKEEENAVDYLRLRVRLATGDYDVIEFSPYAGEIDADNITDTAAAIIAAVNDRYSSGPTFSPGSYDTAGVLVT